MRRKLRDIVATREVVAIAAKQSVLDAAKLMVSKHVGSLLIIDGQKLEGIVTERDILTRVVAQGRDPTTLTVGEVMTRDPIVMSLDRPFSHALTAMADGKFRHLPVVDGHKVVGVVSIRDATGAEHEELDRVLTALDSIVS